MALDLDDEGGVAVFYSGEHFAPEFPGDGELVEVRSGCVVCGNRLFALAVWDGVSMPVRRVSSVCGRLYGERWRTSRPGARR